MRVGIDGSGQARVVSVAERCDRGEGLQAESRRVAETESILGTSSQAEEHDGEREEGNDRAHR